MGRAGVTSLHRDIPPIRLINRTVKIDGLFAGDPHHKHLSAIFDADSSSSHLTIFGHFEHL